MSLRNLEQNSVALSCFNADRIGLLLHESKPRSWLNPKGVALAATASANREKKRMFDSVQNRLRCRNETQRMNIATDRDGM